MTSLIPIIVFASLFWQLIGGFAWLVIIGQPPRNLKQRLITACFFGPIGATIMLITQTVKAIQRFYES